MPTSTVTNLPPKPSTPKPQSAFILIALEEMLNYSDLGGVWTREWNVFASPLTDVILICYDRPIFS